MRSLQLMALCIGAVGSVHVGRDTTRNFGRDIDSTDDIEAQAHIFPDSWFNGKDRCNKQHGRYCKMKIVNELADDQACKEISVIFARGYAVSGNFGPDIGGFFVDEIGMKIGLEKLAVQGVDYENGWGHGTGQTSPGVYGGAMELVRLLNQTVLRCPDTKIVLAGNLNGARVIHDSCYWLTAELGDRFNASKYLLHHPSFSWPLEQECQYTAYTRRFLVVLWNDPKANDDIRYLHMDRMVHFCNWRMEYISFLRKFFMAPVWLLLTSD